MSRGDDVVRFDTARSGGETQTFVVVGCTKCVMMECRPYGTGFVTTWPWSHGLRRGLRSVVPSRLVYRGTGEAMSYLADEAMGHPTDGPPSLFEV